MNLVNYFPLATASVFLRFIMQIIVNPITEQSKTFHVFQNLFPGLVYSVTGLP